MNTIDLKEAVIKAAIKVVLIDIGDFNHEALQMLRKTVAALNETPETKLIRLTIDYCDMLGSVKYEELYEAAQQYKDTVKIE